MAVLSPEATPVTPPPHPASETLPLRTVNQRCAIIQSLPPHFLADGLVIVGDFNKRDYVGDLMALGPDDEEPRRLKELPAFWYDGAISPKGGWFSYRNDPGGHELVVISGDGEVHSTIRWEDQWQSFDWLDDERLVLVRHEVPSVVETLNVLTNERQSITATLPGFWTPTEWLYGKWDVVYDRELTRVAYMREAPAGKGFVPSRFVLWDTQSEQELWAIDRWSPTFIEPVWSPDGTRLAVAVLNEGEDNSIRDRFELFILSPGGSATKWIDISGYYGDLLHLHMKWSPDGRYLAFAPESERPFLILDTVTRQVLNYCITTNAYAGDILWSPDSTQVIAPNWGFRSIVLDLQREIAGYIVEEDDDFRPLAWLARAP